MKIFPLSSWKFRIEALPELIAFLRKSFTAKIKRWRKGRVYYQDVSLGRWGKSWGELPYGLLESFLSHVQRSSLSISSLKLRSRPDWGLADRWRGILRPEQVEGLEKLLRNPGGIFKAYTGFGKTEVQLALVESYLQTGRGKVLVLVPTKSIAEEWKLRAEKYGISSSGFSVVIPQGEMIRAKSGGGIWGELSEYRLVLADEMHHLSSRSWSLLVAALPHLEASFGFSATPDTQGPGISDPLQGFPQRWSYDWALRVGACGPVRVNFLPKGKKRLHLKMVEIPSIPGARYEKYLEAAEALATHPKLLLYLLHFLREEEDRFVFWPLLTIRSGYRIASSLESKGFRDFAFWYSESIESPKGNYRSLEDLKRAAKDGEIRLLLATSLAYEGVDFSEADTVLLTHGKNWRMTLQPLGRARKEEVLAIFPVDRNNGFMLSQLSYRIRVLKEEYDLDWSYWTFDGDTLSPGLPWKRFREKLESVLGPPKGTWKGGR